MFILYSIVIGLVVGFLLGGRTAGLGDLRIRWPWAIAGGLVTQLLLFSTPLTERVGALGPVIYVASTAFVLVAIVVNRKIAGMSVVALGAMSNLVAIIANGGYMPADPAAITTLGPSDTAAYSNSALMADPALRPLTDILVLPPWVPFANVFSIGDAIIGVGVAIVIVSAMRSESPASSDAVVDPPPETIVDPA
jgi:hypothetical protein